LEVCRKKLERSISEEPKTSHWRQTALKSRKKKGKNLVVIDMSRKSRADKKWKKTRKGAAGSVFPTNLEIVWMNILRREKGKKPFKLWK